MSVNASPTPNGKSLTTRYLHLFLLLVVLHQLITSYFDVRPAPGQPRGLIHDVHEYVGLVGLVAVALFWLWTLARNSPDTPLRRLLPWFSREGLAGLGADLGSLARDLARFRMPSLHLDALAGAVHGLGLLAATAMATSGTIYFFTPRSSALHGAALATHHLVANLMWAYVIGHVSLAVIHRLRGDDIFARMFWPRSPAKA
jgi:cytochrome b561